MILDIIIFCSFPPKFLYWTRLFPKYCDFDACIWFVNLERPPVWLTGQKPRLGSKILASTKCLCAQLTSYVWLFATPGTVACQAPLSMGFSRQEYCSGLPFSPPGDLPHSGIELASPALKGRFFYLWVTTEAQWKVT